MGFDLAQAPATFAIIFATLLASGYAFYVDDDVISRFCFQVHAVLAKRQYYRLVTSAFFHADPIHFLFNMLTLFFFGRFMELVLGSTNFLILYFGSELAASVYSLWAKRDMPFYASIGASGAVTGVVFAFCLYRPFADIYLFFIPIGVPAILYAGVYVAYSMYAMRGPGAGIAHEAHLGGAVGGVLLALFLDPRALDIFLSHFR